jgi:hypothetical protein
MRRRAVGSGLGRALIAVCLLAGVFAMHGLTGGHEALDAHRPAAAAAMAETEHGHPAAVQPPHGPAVQAAHDGTHSMADVCLALLTALALAIVAALALRSLRITRPVAPPGSGPRVIRTGRAPPWLQPRLTKLCVLRT